MAPRTLYNNVGQLWKYYLRCIVLVLYILPRKFRVYGFRPARAVLLQTHGLAVVSRTVDQQGVAGYTGIRSFCLYKLLIIKN